jgi:tetratricopeptide (TPR) repeat protein
MQNNGYLWGALIALVIIVGGFFFFRTHTAMAPAPGATTTLSSASTTVTDLGNGISVIGPGGVTIEPVNNSVPPPSLSGSIIIAPSVAPDVAAALRTNEQTLITQLKAAPTRVDLWLSLGVYRKIAGDYAGAIVAWDYVAQTGPKTINYIAYGDLGDLYQNFDTNLPKAEADYKAAIAINPNVIQYYSDLYYLYGTEKNPSAQSAILAQGLKANPNNPDLLQLQK